MLGLYGNDAALIPILFGLEKPVKSKIEDLLQNAALVSMEELAENDGRTDSTPIYLAVNDHVYDVSASRDIYGPGGKYHALAGHDATIAFASACYEPKCLVGTLEKLTEPQKKDILKWDELYSQHDKYTFIGVLAKSDPVGESVDQALHEQASEETTSKDISSEEVSSENTENIPAEVEPVAVEVEVIAEEAHVEEVITDATQTTDDESDSESESVPVDVSGEAEE